MIKERDAQYEFLEGEARVKGKDKNSPLVSGRKG